MAVKPKTMRFDADAEAALREADAAKREAALAFDTPMPAGDGPFYVARPEGRKETRRETVVSDSGSARTVVNEYLFTAFYGPFETHEDVQAFLTAKRSRGTIDWTNAIRVVNAAEARKIKAREAGDDIVG